MSVIIADDDNTFQMLVRRACQMEGLDSSVVLCRNGQEVRERYEPGVHTAVLDLNLGEECGLDLAAWLRERSPDMRLFLISWSMTDEARARSAEIGMECHEKERSFEKLRQFVRRMVQR